MSNSMPKLTTQMTMKNQWIFWTMKKKRSRMSNRTRMKITNSTYLKLNVNGKNKRLNLPIRSFTPILEAILILIQMKKSESDPNSNWPTNRWWRFWTRLQMSNSAILEIHQKKKKMRKPRSKRSSGICQMSLWRHVCLEVMMKLNLDLEMMTILKKSKNDSRTILMKSLRASCILEIKLNRWT